MDHRGTPTIMTTRGIRRLALAGLVVLTACEPQASPNKTPRGCPAACPTGTVCDVVQGFCVAQTTPGTTPPATTCNAPQQTCNNQCVDPRSDPNNCGGCGNSCGQNAICVGGGCQCVGSAKNCNQNWYDGCECSKGCSSNGNCSDAVSNECNPASAGACGSNGAYCDSNNKCVGCPAGFSNCDGMWQCECSGACNGSVCQSSSTTGQCSPGTANSCGSKQAYCDSNTKQCAPCLQGTTNCDGVWACECSQGQTCSGTTCQTVVTCSPSQYNACGDPTHYCDPTTSTCKECASGLFGLGAKRNCDGIGTCETSGTSCPGGTGQPSCASDPNCLSCVGNSCSVCKAGSTRVYSGGVYICVVS